MGEPLVSVIIPTYDRAEILSRAIGSVLDQTYQFYELLVVDDFSNDNTREIVIGYEDERINYLMNEREKGAQGARNTGVLKAQGKYIAFLDSDDKWLPDKLSSQVNLMEKLDDRYALTYCGLRVKNGSNTTTMIPELDGEIYNKVLGFEKWHPPTSTFFVSTYIARDFLFDESFPAFQERDLLLRICKKYLIASLKEPLVEINITQDNIHQGKNVIYGHRLLLAKHKDDIKSYNFQEKYLRLLAGNYFNRLRNVKMSRILLSMPEIERDYFDHIFLCLARFGYYPAKLFSAIVKRSENIFSMIGLKKKRLFS